ncbi:MAG: trimethylamine corrinoid protein 2 [Ruminococcaceae bacterium]|jgi:5-methyltetrahydrofolate--homocysteine methyltransferase|nr:trimethylamine corrinoid protein 2 [Oscillospiraceae bacterium]
MQGSNDWIATRQRFEAWWQRDPVDSPLLHLVVRLDEPIEPLEPEEPFRCPEDRYLDIEQLVIRRRNFYRTHLLLAEAIPQISLDLGPGSLALYLGSEPGFAWDTVWYNACIHDLAAWPKLTYDPDNTWLQQHMAMFNRAQSLIGPDLWLNMPDLIENLDILAALRDPQTLLFDLMDTPELVLTRLQELDDLYFTYFDLFYQLIQREGSNTYTAFNIWGPGRTAKVQCDFSAMIGPDAFKTFVQPTLRTQCRRLDQSLYHLDGPDAIRHVPALMEIDELNALQWTCGAGQPDGGNDRWLPIYDQVRESGKGLHISIYDGGVQDWLAHALKLVRRYGPEGLYLLFPVMSMADATLLLKSLRG